MNEMPLTAEDLTLYALRLLEGDENARVEAMLRASTEARMELANIRGDLALFALATEQHTPPALSRQRLLKQVARESRAPIALPLEDLPRVAPVQTFAPDAAAPTATGLPQPSQQQAAGMAVPRVVSQPDPETFLPEVPAKLPEPQVFSRDPQVSASAHSVTMFEQHFASEATQAAEPALPNDPQAFSRRGAKRDAPALPMEIDAVEDRFTPSRREEDVPFRSFDDERQPTAFSRFFTWAGWAVAATVAAAAAFVVRDDFVLREQVTRQQVALNQATLSAARADTILQTLQSPASQRFVLSRQDTAPAPSARVAYLPERGTLIFQANNMEQLQPYKTYELWLIPAGEGRQPIPAGTFKPDARGFASLTMPQLPRGTVAQNFGVTIEDDPGSSAPTLPILLVGQTS